MTISSFGIISSTVMSSALCSMVCPSFITVSVFQLKQLIFNDLHPSLFIGQNVFQVVDQLFNLFIFLLDLLPFKTGQPLKTHIQNCSCLDLRSDQTSPSTHFGLFPGPWKCGSSSITSSRLSRAIKYPSRIWALFSASPIHTPFF